MAVDPGVRQRRIFVAPESEDRLVRLFGVEDPQLH